MSNKLYDILKWIVLTVLPAVSALYSGLGIVYGWPNVDTNTTALSLITAFLGTLLGVSSYQYNKKEDEDGE